MKTSFRLTKVWEAATRSSSKKTFPCLLSLTFAIIEFEVEAKGLINQEVFPKWGM